MAITINGSGTIGGVSVGGLPDGSVDNDTLASGIASSKLTGALPAVDGSSLTGNIGITHITQYYMTSDYYGTSYIPMQNWSQNTTLQRANLGTAVSQSGGVFTFPVTGLWRIELTATLYKAGDARECIAGIQRTIDNGSSWSDLCLAQGHVDRKAHV